MVELSHFYVVFFPHRLATIKTLMLSEFIHRKTKQSYLC